VKIKTDLQLQTTDRSVRIDVRATSDLSDLQRKFDAIVKTFPLPKDNCPGYGQHVLPKIETAALKAQGTTALLEVAGTADIWDCQKNPVREMVVHKKKRCLRGYCIDVPSTIEWRAGSPIKNKVTEGFKASVALSLVTPDGKTIDVKAGAPSISPRGELGKFFNALAGIFNKDLSSVAQNKLDELVDAGLLRKAIPDDFMKYDPTIKSVQFRADGGTLLADVSFGADVSASQLSEFLKKALDSTHPK
jgi:hypothetical protein